VIDTCNPFSSRDGEIANWAREKGAGRASAELLPGARIVRAFNALSYRKLADDAHRPSSPDGVPTSDRARHTCALEDGLVGSARCDAIADRV